MSHPSKIPVPAAPAPTLNEKEIRAQAEADLGDIETLRRTPAFERYFVRKLKERRNRITDQLLDIEDLTKVPELRALRREIGDLLGMLDRDEQGNRSILSQG